MDGVPTLPRHLYVHVPLCRARCAYCDFFSLTPGDLRITPDALVDGLVNQARAWAERGLAPGGIDTLYVGGGTPTMLGDSLATLVSTLAVWAETELDAEITVEANPDSLTPELAELLAMAGVTRVSLGVQSFDDAELAMLGRLHTADEAIDAASCVTGAGLELSVDLMCGLPGQSRASFERSLRQAIATGTGHVSVYPIAVEDGTPLAGAIARGAITAPDNDVAADMLLDAEQVLGAAGLVRYETSNFARLDRVSRHNLAYWTGAEYLGVGPGAAGMLHADTARATGIVVPVEAARVRYHVVRDLTYGLAFMPRVEIETLDAREADREDAMLGLRLVTGIDDALVARAGIGPVMESLAADGLVGRRAGRWATTQRGWLLGNEVFGRVWSGP